MRADYATSDLISKVNAEWINAVLINHELEPGDATNDGVPGGPTLRPGPGKQIVRAWPKPVPPSGKPTERPAVFPEPLARLHRRRTVARRVGERLALAVAALAIVWVGIRAAPEARDATDQVPVRATRSSAP